MNRSTWQQRSTAAQQQPSYIWNPETCSRSWPAAARSLAQPSAAAAPWPGSMAPPPACASAAKQQRLPADSSADARWYDARACQSCATAHLSSQRLMRHSSDQARPSRTHQSCMRNCAPSSGAYSTLCLMLKEDILHCTCFSTSLQHQRWQNVQVPQLSASTNLQAG